MKEKYGVIIAVAALCVVFLAILAVILSPSLPRYDFSSVAAAKEFGRVEDTVVVEIVGDTNGPFQLVSVEYCKPGQSPKFDLNVDGKKLEWTRAATNLSLSVLVFANPQGSQMAVVRERAPAVNDPLEGSGIYERPGMELESVK